MIPAMSLYETGSLSDNQILSQAYYFDFPVMQYFSYNLIIFFRHSVVIQ